MLTLATFSEAECHIRHHFHHFPIAATTSLTKHIHSPETFYKKATPITHGLHPHQPSQPTFARDNKYIRVHACARHGFSRCFYVFRHIKDPFSKKREATHDSNHLFTAMLLPLPPYSCHSLQHFSLAAITEDKHITTKQQKRACQKFFFDTPLAFFFSIDYSWRLRTATASTSISHSGRHTRASTIRQVRSG